MATTTNGNAPAPTEASQTTTTDSNSSSPTTSNLSLVTIHDESAWHKLVAHFESLETKESDAVLTRLRCGVTWREAMHDLSIFRMKTFAATIAKIVVGVAPEASDQLLAKFAGDNVIEIQKARVAAREPSPTVTADPVVKERASVAVGDVKLWDQPPRLTYPTAIPALNDLLGGGFKTRAVTVIMAPPGQGKSAYTISEAVHMQKDVPMLVISTELETTEVTARIVAPMVGLPWTDVEEGRAPRTDVDAALASLRIRVIGCERLPRGFAAVREVVAIEVAAFVEEYGCAPVVVLDYLQQLARGANTDNMRGMVGDISTELRTMAQELNVALLLVSSVARTWYTPKKAQELRELNNADVYLSAAKEAGDIEFDANVILFLDVLPSEPGVSYRVGRIAVAKNRRGSTGFAGARFHGATGRWEAAPDTILQAAQERTKAAQSVDQESDDKKVLATIERAAKAHVWRTRNQWLETFRSEAGLSKGKMGSAIARLLESGQLCLSGLDDLNRRAPKNGQWLMVPTPAA